MKDVDFLHRAIRVRQTISEVEGVLRIADTKSKSSRRTIATPEFLLDELAAHLALEGRHEPDDLVFTGPKGGPLRRSFAARVFTPAVERAGLPKALTFHGLRHVATTFMIEAGEHPESSSTASAMQQRASRWSSTPTSPTEPIARLRPDSKPASPLSRGLADLRESRHQ